MAHVVAVCRSDTIGTNKEPVSCGVFKVEHGLVGDAHAGLDPKREISMLALESIARFNQKGYDFKPGDFAENLTTEGIELTALHVGSRLSIGKHVIVKVTQIGKQCHLKCAIYHRIGKCIMPKEGVFAAILRGGEVKSGDTIMVIADRQELIELRDKLHASENKFAEIQKKTEANTDYRNELIWLSQDINRITASIKELEKSI